MIYQIVRTEEEIDEVNNRIMEAMVEGTKFSGMTYEEGCQYMLQWLIGEIDEDPMEQ